MKIAVSAKGGSIHAQMDERFGRCEYFIIVDSETMKFNAVFNPSADASGGAGPAAAKKSATRTEKKMVAPTEAQESETLIVITIAPPTKTTKSHMSLVCIRIDEAYK